MRRGINGTIQLRDGGGTFVPRTVENTAAFLPPISVPIPPVRLTPRGALVEIHLAILRQALHRAKQQ